jgi:carbamoyltransferase
MKHLLLTLGHNSSAVLVQDGKLVAGYEEERLTGVKSDSRFPINAIAALLGNDKPDMIYCTHWQPYADLSEMGGKYWNPEYAEDIPVRSHTDNTHHDTHAFGALAFAGLDFPNDKTYVMVVDGFGSFGEHFSMYRLTNSRSLELVFRGRGYDTSLGLMYQYATAFMGMKMHEDEYKLLGYEVHVTSTNADKLEIYIDRAVETWAMAVHMPHLGSEYDPIFNVAALPAVRERFFKIFGEVLAVVGITNPTTFDARATLAYFIQTVLEGCVIRILNQYDVRNLIVSGGCFYNVKLNKILLDAVPGKFCAYPLAGDQGNAIGLYAMDHPKFRMPNDLFWGHRRLENVGEVKGLEYITYDQITERVVDKIMSGPGYVNLVRGSMEFGPRALCNTSTLALPARSIVNTINTANNRNTVMPMAPVMTRSQWRIRYQNCDKVWRSEEYMILAMEHKNRPHGMEGASHHYGYPFQDHWTGRPQVIRPTDGAMTAILEETGPLINTSFNYHGMPIAYDMPSIIENHQKQHLNNPSFTTFVVTD